MKDDKLECYEVYIYGSIYFACDAKQYNKQHDVAIVCGCEQLCLIYGVTLYEVLFQPWLTWLP
jgi:hypothetical protein